MDGFEDYPLWELVAEEVYKTQNEILRKGTYEKFCNLEAGKAVYMFGCNGACKRFVKCYREMYHFAGVLDNAREKWGSSFCGLPVLQPAVCLSRLEAEEAVVVIALRSNADTVSDMLEREGFQNYYSLAVLLSGISPYREMVEYMEQAQKMPVEDLVIMESTGDLDGNSGELYAYLKRRRSSHRFIWVVKDKKAADRLVDDYDVAVCPEAGRKEMETYVTYRAKAKWQIWDNNPIRKVRDEQINVFLQHFGMGYKQISGLYRCPDYVDYVLTPNRNVYEYEKHALFYPSKAKILFGELPRNDVLFSDKWDELSKITGEKYRKILMWAPTLRASAVSCRRDSELVYPYGVSLLYRKEDMEALNKFLAQESMLLLIKIHPRQECNYGDEGYSNILYLDQGTTWKVHPYKLLTQVDAMITDYSSIVFDYMLLDRPIAWILEDIEYYKVPFLMENPLDFMPGNHIYTQEQLLEFLGQVSRGEDPYRRRRNMLSERYNAPKEGKGCENIVRVLGLEQGEFG